MSGSPVPGRRHGPGPATALLIAACLLALLAFDRPAPERVAAAVPAMSARTTPARPTATAPARIRAAAPLGRAAERRLGPTAGRAVALTFDDGPDPRWTPRVLDLLRRYHVRATFCVVGRHVAEHPELVRRIAAEGHALCDHTWTHDEHLERRTPAQVAAEIGRTYRAIVAATHGTGPAYFRAPGGRWTPGAVAEAGRLGLRPLGWSVDPSDWRRPPAARIAHDVLAGATPRAIVLMHDGYGRRANSVAALRTVLPALAARHLTCTLP